MKSYKKNYIGKGTQVEPKSGKALDIVKVTLGVEEMMKFVHEYKEKEYITFEVAILRNKDQFGHTHTVYTTIVEEVEETPQVADSLDCKSMAVSIGYHILKQFMIYSS